MVFGVQETPIASREREQKFDTQNTKSTVKA